MLTIGNSSAIGRQALAKKVGLGEGAIRTILKRLRDQGYVETNAYGCVLSPKGKKAFSEIKAKIPKIVPIPETKLTIGSNQVALVVKGASSRVSNGIRERDASIKVGASGATTYLVRDSRFTVPKGSTDCEKDFPGTIWARLRGELQPKSGDVVIVCGSDNEITSELGAISAALTLVVYGN
jgi:predicted transcriptional regulator